MTAVIAALSSGWRMLIFRRLNPSFIGVKTDTVRKHSHMRYGFLPQLQSRIFVVRWERSHIFYSDSCILIQARHAQPTLQGIFSPTSCPSLTLRYFICSDDHSPANICSLFLLAFTDTLFPFCWSFVHRKPIFMLIPAWVMIFIALIWPLVHFFTSPLFWLGLLCLPAPPSLMNTLMTTPIPTILQTLLLLLDVLPHFPPHFHARNHLTPLAQMP